MTRPLPKLDAPRRLAQLPVRQHRLANGLGITVVERRELPMVHLELIVRGGAELDAPGHAGQTSMLAEMLDEGTPARTAPEIAEQIDHLGAYFDSRVGYDALTVSLRVLSGRLEAALDIVADALLNADFPDAQFRRKQSERLTALVQECDEAALLAGKALAAGIFGDAHPYGMPLNGRHVAIERLQRADIVALYEQRFAAAGAHIIAVGDVAADDFVRVIERHLGAWPARTAARAADIAPAPALPTRVLLVDKPGAAQAEVRLGFAAPPRTTPDFFALLVLNTVLGGSFTSRLNMILRERMGVTYGASSRFRLRRGGGVFTSGAAIMTAAAARSAKVIVDEMRKLQDGPVPGDELERAQSYLALGLPRSFETAEDIAAHIRELVLYALPPDYWQTYVDRVLEVSAADVARVAARHLHPDHSAIVVVADQGDVRSELERSGLGEVLLTNVAT